MAKRGPKRKTGARYPSGKLRPVPLGPTRELLAKRLACLLIAGVDPSKTRNLANTGLDGPEQTEYFRLAESWLGVLYAAGVIDAHQFRAGNAYHEIYSVMFPQGFPGSSLDLDMPRLNGTPHQPFEQRDQENPETDIGLSWKTTESILAQLGRRTHDLVKNICVFGRFERFIDVSSPRTKEAWRADSEDKTRFLCGLDALAMAYGYKAAPSEIRLAA